MSLFVMNYYNNQYTLYALLYDSTKHTFIFLKTFIILYRHYSNKLECFEPFMYSKINSLMY